MISRSEFMTLGKLCQGRFPSRSGGRGIDIVIDTDGRVGELDLGRMNGVTDDQQSTTFALQLVEAVARGMTRRRNGGDARKERRPAREGVNPPGRYIGRQGGTTLGEHLLVAGLGAGALGIAHPVIQFGLGEVQLRIGKGSLGTV